MKGKEKKAEFAGNIQSKPGWQPAQQPATKVEEGKGGTEKKEEEERLSQLLQEVWQEYLF